MFGNRIQGYRNSKRMAVNGIAERLCKEEEVGYVDFLTQHVLEPTRAARVSDIVLSSQKEFVDNVVIQEPLGSSDNNQLHFNIKKIGQNKS